MIEVTGEGARFWPRWRGPSGQGSWRPASTPTLVADDQRQVARADSGRRQFVADRLGLIASY